MRYVIHRSGWGFTVFGQRLLKLCIALVEAIDCRFCVPCKTYPPSEKYFVWSDSTMVAFNCAVTIFTLPSGHRQL